MSLIRKHGAVLQAWACLDLVAKLSCFCVDYFNKTAELVFATVFDTHMCRNKKFELMLMRRAAASV